MTFHLYCLSLLISPRSRALSRLSFGGLAQTGSCRVACRNAVLTSDTPNALPSMDLPCDNSFSLTAASRAKTTLSACGVAVGLYALAAGSAEEASA